MGAVLGLAALFLVTAGDTGPAGPEKAHSILHTADPMLFDTLMAYHNHDKQTYSMAQAVTRRQS